MKANGLIERHNYALYGKFLPNHSIRAVKVETFCIQQLLIKPATRRVAGRSPAIGFLLLFVAGLKANSCKIQLRGD